MKVTNFTLIAGYSNSTDFTKRTGDTAFAYALDFRGNPVWSRIFANESDGGKQIEKITTCQLDGLGWVTMGGFKDGKPVVLHVGMLTGKVFQFLRLESNETATTYSQFRGIYT
jgi:hypothetical protein